MATSIPSSANADLSSSASANSANQIIDDKSRHCIPFILSLLSRHQSSPTSPPNKPFIIGLNGVQGAGKTTLVSTLAQTLREQEGLETLVLSIDDLYLTHEDQLALAIANPHNPLIQHRGEPGTHDIPLARTLFRSLLSSSPTPIPIYDKSLHSGHGDRLPPSSFPLVNKPGSPPVRVIIFEGWCVGFRSLPSPSILSAREACIKLASSSDEGQSLSPSGEKFTLHKYQLEDLEFINDKLKEYDVITDSFDAFIHIDAERTEYVYEWRLEQEAAMRREKGRGMSDEEVVKFVDGYYPAYELFEEGVRKGVLGERGRQLRLVVGRNRRVKEVIEI